MYSFVSDRPLNCSCISMSLSSRGVVARAETQERKVANTWSIDKVHVCKIAYLNSLRNLLRGRIADTS